VSFFILKIIMFVYNKKMSSNVFADSTAPGFTNPQSVRYSNLLPIGTPASTKMVSFSASNPANYTPDGVSEIEIPISYPGFLDGGNSYLQFTLESLSTIAGGAANILTRLDGSAYSLFSRIRIENPDGSIVMDLNESPTLMAVMQDVVYSEEFKNSIGGVSQGCSQTRWVGNTTNDDVAAVAVGRYYPVAVSKDQDLAGVVMTVGAANARTFTLPLLSILNAEKYIPLHKISRGGRGLTLKLTLAPARQCIRTSVGTQALAVDQAAANILAYSISNCTFEGMVVNFGDNFNAQFDQVMSGGGVSLHLSNWTHQRVPLNAGASQSLAISARYKSIKSIIVVLRSTAELITARSDHYRVASRSTMATTSYQWRIGSELVPSKRVEISARNPGRAMHELLRAFGYSAGKIHGSRGSGITVDNYYLPEFVEGTQTGQTAIAAGAAGITTNNAGACSKFAIGIDLESYVNENLESGLNSSDTMLPIFLELIGTIVAGSADVYINFDSIYNVSNAGVTMAS
jgi:hypothetical protein